MKNLLSGGFRQIKSLLTCGFHKSNSNLAEMICGISADRLKEARFIAHCQTRWRIPPRHSTQFLTCGFRKSVPDLNDVTFDRHC